MFHIALALKNRNNYLYWNQLAQTWGVSVSHATNFTSEEEARKELKAANIALICSDLTYVEKL